MIKEFHLTLLLLLRVNLEVMAMKGCSKFSRDSELEPHHQIILRHIQDTCCERRSYTSSEMQLTYSSALADWVDDNQFRRRKTLNSNQQHCLKIDLVFNG